MNKSRILVDIKESSSRISPYWPLHRFVCVNPLSGLVSQPFFEAIETSLQLGEYSKNMEFEPINRLMIKYLAAFLDEGQASWKMPGRENGFFHAFITIARHDPELHRRHRLSTYKTVFQTIFDLSQSLSDKTKITVFESIFLALPGWVGFIKWRSEQTDYFPQSRFPIFLHDYLAVRLILHDLFDLPLPTSPVKLKKTVSIETLSKSETKYRNSFLKAIRTDVPLDPVTQADAQLVFCIDVRSEVFRRYLEMQGRYETFGFAGFFGLPIRYHAFGSDHRVDSCPVLIKPKFEMSEQPMSGFEKEGQARLESLSFWGGLKASWSQAKFNTVGCFSTVEMSGLFFGFRLLLQTLIPRSFMKILKWFSTGRFSGLALKMTRDKTESGHYGLTQSEQLFYAETALRVMGFNSFSPLVIFVGHASHTINNPYASGLNCGACGGNSGDANARVLAEILNDFENRKALLRRGIEIPDETVFVGALHSTTTDKVELFWNSEVDASRFSQVQRDLNTTGNLVRLERTSQLPNLSSAAFRAVDWSEVRPEWGLARNAAMIIGPRSLSQNSALDGRVFMHSYDAEADKDGKILEVIMSAPMVVAQWINAQYYFSNLDNGLYGSGSKSIQNVTGKFGVMQGNGSDLMTGLSLQSLRKTHTAPYHESIRLQVVVYAPLDRVEAVLSRNQSVAELVHNEWLHLIVLEPGSDEFQLYRKTK